MEKDWLLSRQLAELDQRLKFQEAHLRELRPRVNSIGDESRHNKQQSQDLREMVEALKETARSSLGSVLTRVKEWEAATINLKEETQKQSQTEEGHQFQINNLEQQVAALIAVESSPNCSGWLSRSLMLIV